MSFHRLTIKLAAASLCGTLLLAGCGDATADRAGGEAVTPRVLSFAQIGFEPPPQLASWADAVERASEGTLSIEFRNRWRNGEQDFEAGTIRDVAAGEVDMAWVGAGAFDTVGVTTFQALLAPLLVDSHELQAEVFEAGIPEQMLAGLSELGVVGVVALPGPMIKMLGKDHPFVVPGDYAGEVIGIQLSELYDRTFVALGATAAPLPGRPDISGVDGYAQQLALIWRYHFEVEADYVTANVNLWPRPLVLFANADIYESLDEQQRDALDSVSASTFVAAALEASRAEDADGASSLCDAGMQFPAASDAALTELRDALESVYAELRSDPVTSAFLDAMEAIKDDVGAPPHTVGCPQTAEGAATAIDGVYTATLTGQDVRDAGCDSPNLAWMAPDDELYFKLTLSAGRLELLESLNGGDFEPGFIGTYGVFRDRVELADPVGSFTVHWSFDGRKLVLRDMEGGLCDDEVVWTTHPWVLIERAKDAATTSIG